MSLTTRINIVAGTQLVGNVGFWTKALAQMDILLSLSLLHLLEKKDKRRVYMKEVQNDLEISSDRAASTSGQKTPAVLALRLVGTLFILYC